MWPYLLLWEVAKGAQGTWSHHWSRDRNWRTEGRERGRKIERRQHIGGFHCHYHHRRTHTPLLPSLTLSSCTVSHNTVPFSLSSSIFLSVSLIRPHCGPLLALPGQRMGRAGTQRDQNNNNNMTYSCSQSKSQETNNATNQSLGRESNTSQRLPMEQWGWEVEISHLEIIKIKQMKKWISPSRFSCCYTTKRTDIFQTVSPCW